MARKTFAPTTLAAIRDGMVLGVRAGRAPHRVIGIWAVVVDGRVFARSWSVKAGGWYRTFRADPVGAIVPMGRTRGIPVKALQVRGERLRDAVSRAYAEKYRTPGSRKYVRDLCRPKSRNTTTEFVPR